jgi:hypothetical protein
MKWISVKDRLPEEKDTVLIYIPHPNCYYRYPEKRMFVATFKNNNFFSHYSDQFIEISHWMPLPPKPDDDLFAEDEYPSWLEEWKQKTKLTLNLKRVQ